MNTQQTEQSQRASEKTEASANPLMFPHAGRDERAFLAAELGTEIAPGRFVLNSRGVSLGYLFSQASDPQFQKALRETGFLSGSFNDSSVSRISDEVSALAHKVRALIESHQFPIGPLAMHPRMDSDASPLFAVSMSLAQDQQQQLEIAGMRYVVQDENIVIPSDTKVSHREILIAETIAQIQKREGYIHQCGECFEIIQEILRTNVPNGETIAATLKPPFAPGIAGATFFAHRVLPPPDGAWPTLKSFMEGMVGIADARGLNTVSDLFRRTEATVRECLDAALIPAAKTMDALRAYNESKVALGRCEERV